MPARPQWLTRVPQIVAELEAIDTPVIDRAILEQTFGVRRRRAAQLMRVFGGYQTGRSYLVERLLLIAQLNQIATSGAFTWELRRRERLTQALEAVRRHRRTVAITIPAPDSHPIPDLLPPGVQLSPGLLKIEFERPVDLLEKLFHLAQTINGNFEWFESSSKS